MFSGTTESIKKLAIFITALFVVGCIAISQKSGYSEKAAAQIIAHETTLNSVLEKLGPPDSVAVENGVIIYFYQREEKGSQKELLPMPAPTEILEASIMTSVTYLIIEIDAQTKVVSSVERRNAK